MWDVIRYRVLTRQATREFRDFLLPLVAAIGDIYDQDKDSRQLVDRFLREHSGEASVRQKVFLDELKRTLNAPMSDGERATRLAFEYFFIVNDKYDSELQSFLKDEFLIRIQKAFAANGIYRP